MKKMLKNADYVKLLTIFVKYVRNFGTAYKNQMY